MDIYGDTQSGNCMKVKHTADLLGLGYRRHAVNIMESELRHADFLRINPHGQVTVIVLRDGRSLSQSNAIKSYLAEGSHLLPSESCARAKVMQWLFWEQYSHEP